MTAAAPRGWAGLRRLLLALVLLASALPAAAVCAYTETGGTLGSVSSFRVRNGPVITNNALFNLNCGLVVLSVIGTPIVQARITSATTGLTLKYNGYSIPYEISTPGGQAYTSGVLVINVNGATAVGLLNSSGTNLPIRITTTVGGNVPAGTYTDTIRMNWTYSNVCEGVAILNGCLGTTHNGNTERVLTVQLVVTNDCTINAPNIQFGTAPLPSGFNPVAQSLSVLCTRDVVYTVGLGPGANPSGGRRQMANGANRLAYDIFKPDTSVWGSVGAARVSTPLSDGITPQLLPYNARVYSDQAPQPAGLYQDNVAVEVQF